MIPGGVRIFQPALDNATCRDRPALPAKGDERSAFPVALGIALSGHDLTPDFLHTHQDKREQLRRKRITGTIFLAGVMILSALIALHLFFITAHKKIRLCKTVWIKNWQELIKIFRLPISSR